MWFFKRGKERKKNIDRIQSEIEDIRIAKIKRHAEVEAKIDFINQYIEDNPNDVASKVFKVTGGEKRVK